MMPLITLFVQLFSLLPPMLFFHFLNVSYLPPMLCIYPPPPFPPFALSHLELKADSDDEGLPDLEDDDDQQPDP